MAAGRLRVEARVAAWWLGGEEECPHCGQLYAYEIEFRCPDCDGPSCPHCRHTHSEGYVICLDCASTVEEPGNG